MGENALFSWACNEIEENYNKLDHQLGYRFLLSSHKTLSPNTEILVLGTNPGGDRIPPDHPPYSCEDGPAYLHEVWGDRRLPGTAPLQVQIRRLFENLSRHKGSKDWTSLMPNSLLAYYIPFRSSSINSLHRGRESRDFAFKLWSKLLNSIDPKIIICIDNKGTFPAIERILHNKYQVRPGNHTKLLVGWGDITAEMKYYDSPGNDRCLILLPHLSRFKIFGRPASQPYIDQLLSKAAQCISNP